MSCALLLTSNPASYMCILHLNAGMDHVLDVNHLPSLKDFPEAREALWSLCRTLHSKRQRVAAAKPHVCLSEHSLGSLLS